MKIKNIARIGIAKQEIDQYGDVTHLKEIDAELFDAMIGFRRVYEWLKAFGFCERMWYNEYMNSFRIH